MGAQELKHNLHRRMTIYTALENLNFHWDLKEVLEFDRMWNEGFCITDIARAFKRPVNEVVVLAIDRREKGHIVKRIHGVFGRRMPDELR